MNHKMGQNMLLLGLVLSNLVICTWAYPQQYQQHTVEQRKFAEKPNAIKKVALDDIDEIQTNQIQEGGFSWSNMLGLLMQMIFNGGGGGGGNVPTKSDDIDNGVSSFGQSPWANVISVGLKIITTLLGGGGAGDGIDKVDNGGSPMQFINIVVNLLDALKTSFSHRSLTARNLGKKDVISDATVASLSMMKGYVRSTRNADDRCMQKFLCEANIDCMGAIGGSSIFCQLGSYATSYILERQTGKSFESFYEAGRNGRSGFDCRQLYLECNEV
ncbi:uncharacterized protein LOC126565138 isoform X2 [Anopheles maculipalpis]|uniref:uncharacterized protein LOC126565138 isoform X2 n=1 Tax=Anopheles maculipalpis TaxID=1496333 RepID=UPI0021599384|nr:uncharacterized protein LOC126565138 isoform X2 [Anopheles maculipalpis]